VGKRSVSNFIGAMGERRKRKETITAWLMTIKIKKIK
jgi:hypothetical protein